MSALHIIACVIAYLVVAVPLACIIGRFMAIGTDSDPDDEVWGRLRKRPHIHSPGTPKADSGGPLNARPARKGQHLPGNRHEVKVENAAIIHSRGPAG